MEPFELLAVLLALLVLAAPVLAIVAVVRQRRLRLRIEEVAHQTSQQNDALHRELLELRRQVATLTKPVPDTVHEYAAEPTVPISAPKPHTVVEKPVAVENSVEKPAVTEKPVQPVPAQRIVAKAPSPAPATNVILSEGAAPRSGSAPQSKDPSQLEHALPAKDQKKEINFCPWCGTAHEGGVANCPTAKPAAPPVEKPQSEIPPAPHTPTRMEVPLRTSIPLELKAPAAEKPADKTVAAPTTEQKSPAPPKVEPAPPKVAHTPPVAHVPPHAPHRAQASQYSVLRDTPQRPTAQQRMKSVLALEETLGTNWLNKIGITLVVLGIALFGIWKLGQMGPAGKVGLSVFASLAFLGGGVFLEKRDRYRVLGHTLIGGGWALLFFTTYALNHVQAMRVLDSEPTDLILMLATALAMVVHTLRYRSQLVTGLSFLLAYTTVSLSHDTVYSLAASVILAGGLVSIVLKFEWYELEVFGIVAAYFGHLYWLYRLLGPQGANGQAFPEYHASTALLLFYWVIFRMSYVVRRIKSPAAEHVSTAAALLNTLLLLGAMRFQSVHPELAFIALLAIGAVEFTCGQLPITRRRREAFIILTVLGSALMITAVPFRYSGNNVAILWLIGAEALLIAGVVVGEIVFRRIALLTGYLVAFHLIRVDFMDLLAIRRVNEELVLSAGIMFSLCAVIFYMNSLYVGERWKSFFADRPDSELLRGHSYLGTFAAVLAVWALCSRDWTALALAAVMLALAGLGKKLQSFHLQVQYIAIAMLTLVRVVMVNLHSDAPTNTHLSVRLITLPAIAAGFYAAAKWAQQYDDSNQRSFRGFFALVGTVLLIALIYYEVPELWQPTAAIVFAVALVEIGQFLKYHALAWHGHLLTCVALVASVAADSRATQRWHDIPLHAFGALPVIAGAYWIAKRISVPNSTHVNLACALYSWMAAGLTLWVLEEAVPSPWIAVSWIAFAVALALIMRRIGYRQLAWQANAVAACTIIRAFDANFTLAQTVWPGVSLRLVTISLIAAGLYYLSRAASVEESPAKPAITYLHTFAATGLLAYLAWFEAPGAWLAAVWAIFALVLALIDRKFELDDLRWQAHGLAAISLMRGVGINLYINENWHGINLRLLSLAIVAIVMYALAQILRMPQRWRERDFHHIYSWAASALVSLLMWYELQPLSIAVGWGIFGLVLFEYGLLRKVKQFRFQAYVALAAAFGRIFFANLAAGTPGEFWGPRTYTVLPLTLIFFFVYAQLETDATIDDDRRLHFDDLLCYLGTGSVVAVLYFQFPNDWMVTAFAVTVFALFGAALFLNRPIFLYQGILLTVGTCVRAIMHNLFGASYFTDGDWTGRYVVLGSAVAVLLATLPFAFRLRDRLKQHTSRIPWIGSILRHPEQFMFFAPVALLTLMLAVKMRSGMVTVSWSIEGVLIILLALAVGERSFRLTGFVLLLVCFGKIIFHDMWGLGRRDQYLTLIILGIALLLVHFLYVKYRETIRQFL